MPQIDASFDSMTTNTQPEDRFAKLDEAKAPSPSPSPSPRSQSGLNFVTMTDAVAVPDNLAASTAASSSSTSASAAFAIDDEIEERAHESFRRHRLVKKHRDIPRRLA
ncbi:uncharacterized protein JCM10292_000034 [Rhodotorula paludigena]|uniref:uncharacterized protein n=1 Tax=Rhodotorula paludigena TaxID=86838 RepID=UPI00316CA523